MTVKRKDFQKTATYIHEFLLKLNGDGECAELRDALNYTLLHMQKYYRVLQQRKQQQDAKLNGTSSVGGNSSGTPSPGYGSYSVGSVRGLSPMTPYTDAPCKFQWHWVSLDHQTGSPRVVNSSRSIASSRSADGQPPVDQQQGSGSARSSLMTPPPPLHHASKVGDLLAIASMHAQNPQSIHDTDCLGRSALIYAVHYCQLDVAEWLVSRGLDMNAEADDGSTALHRACHNGVVEAVELLLRWRADVNKGDAYDRAPIHWAVTTTATDCLRLLIDHGANVNVRDRDGLSPSMWACRLDHIDHFVMLSKVKNQKIDEPDGMERDHNGRTWLHWAVRRNEPLECLRTLLTEGTAALKDYDGRTVILLAAEMGSLPSCKLVVEMAGADCIHDCDDQDRTPLHLATMGGHGEVVNFLLEKGANPERRDRLNATAWDYSSNRHLHYCQLIIASHVRQRLLEREGEHGLTSASTWPGMMTSSRKNSRGEPDETRTIKTPPRPPTTPPNQDRSPTPRRIIKRQDYSGSSTSTLVASSGGQQMNGNPSGNQRLQTNSDRSPELQTNGDDNLDRGFDRRESEELETFGLVGYPQYPSNGQQHPTSQAGTDWVAGSLVVDHHSEPDHQHQNDLVQQQEMRPSPPQRHRQLRPAHTEEPDHHAAITGSIPPPRRHQRQVTGPVSQSAPSIVSAPPTAGGEPLMSGPTGHFLARSQPPARIHSAASVTTPLSTTTPPTEAGSSGANGAGNNPNATANGQFTSIQATRSSPPPTPRPHWPPVTTAGAGEEDVSPAPPPHLTYHPYDPTGPVLAAPQTPPEARRRVVLPVQLAPISFPSPLTGVGSGGLVTHSADSAKRKKRRKQQQPTAPPAAPVTQIQKIWPGSASGHHGQTATDADFEQAGGYGSNRVPAGGSGPDKPLANGRLPVSGFGGNSRPLQPSQNRALTGRGLHPASAGSTTEGVGPPPHLLVNDDPMTTATGGAPTHLHSPRPLSPLVIPPPRGFRNDANSTESSPKEVTGSVLPQRPTSSRGPAPAQSSQGSTGAMSTLPPAINSNSGSAANQNRAHYVTTASAGHRRGWPN